MIKNIISKLIQFRNPAFSFSPDLNLISILGFSLRCTMRLIRGLKVIFILKNPKWALFEKGVSMQYTRKISWGKFLKLGKAVTLSALGTDGIKLGNNVSIGSFSSIIVSTSLNDIGKHIIIRNNVGIGEYAYLGGAGGIEIGEDSIIGQYFSCHSENHLFKNPNESIRKQGVERKGISIGANCWIGSKVTITDGVKIGSGCVIAAGAVVTKSFPDNSLIGGVPARLIKNRLS